MGLLVVHAAATWFMVGLIWTIQAVHYPLFRLVGEDGFTAYEAAHTARMGRLLAVPAGAEVVTAALLVRLRPDGVPLWLVLAAGAVLAGLWVTTALVQVPLHRRLGEAPEAAALAHLTATNWWRTAGWTLRGLLVGTMLLLA